MDMARKMIQLAQTRQLELELENTRNLALIELATQALKPDDQSSEKTG